MIRNRYDRRNRSLDSPVIDLSSMMDIIFILLIFVMASISFTKDFHQVEMDLPEVSNSSKGKGDEIYLDIKVKEGYFLDSKLLTINEIEQKSKDGYFENKIVTVSVEKKVEYEKFIQLIEILKSGKMHKLNLGVK